MSTHRDPYPTFSTERPVQYADLEKAWDNGDVAIQTWTLPSGNVPILTLLSRITMPSLGHSCEVWEDRGAMVPNRSLGSDAKGRSPRRYERNGTEE